MSWSAHLPVLPIVLPLAAGALMLVFDERRERLKAAISLVALALLLVAALDLLRLADRPLAPVYALGSWAAASVSRTKSELIRRSPSAGARSAA